MKNKLLNLTLRLRSSDIRKGINYYHEGMGYITRTQAEIDADMDDIVAAGVTHIRIVANPLAASHAQAVLAIQRAKAKGLIVHSGANFDGPNSISFDAGTATGGTATSLVDSTKNWTENEFVGFEVYLTSGTGSGQAGVISANTANTLTITALDSFGIFGTAPNETTAYKISFEKLSQKTWEYPVQGYAAKVVALAADFYAAGADCFSVGNEISTHVLSNDSFVNTTNLPTQIKNLAEDVAEAGFNLRKISYDAEFWNVGKWHDSGLGRLGFIGFNFYNTLTGFVSNIDDAIASLGAYRVVATEWSSESTFGAGGYTEEEWTTELNKRKEYLKKKNILGFAFTYRETTDDGFGYRKSVATGGVHDAWEDSFSH